ncbi:bacillithiol biosynthesis deacetylase BshB1, partial [Bacteroidota bacterium]
MKLDILVFAAHPDDAELSCSGTIAKQVSLGKKTGIIDLTLGDLGTRGNPKIRIEEAKKAAEILGLSARENLKIPDGFLDETQENLDKVIRMIRKYNPEVVLANAVADRHPDHGKGSSLVSRASFLAGLTNYETELNGITQESWRPKAIYHYIQNNYINPDFIIDISDYWDIKIRSIKAFASQFYDAASKEPETFISSQGFLDFIQARAMEYGHAIGVKYGEG